MGHLHEDHDRESGLPLLSPHRRTPSFHQVIRARRMRTIGVVLFFFCLALWSIAGHPMSADGWRDTLRLREDPRAEVIKEAYLWSWDAYVEKAWGWDELKPISGVGHTPRNGWGATIVDGLSTAIIMELEEPVHRSLQFIKDIDFTKTNDTVSLFETTIRYLGGLLSGYDLLKGPYKHLVRKGDGPLVDNLLKQAITLANALSFGFETATGIPSNELNFVERRMEQNFVAGLAVVGSLVMEWDRLAQLSGNATYSKLVHKAQEYLLNPSPPENEPFPGMLGTHLSIDDGKFLDAMGGWSSETDSFYEYLLKMYMVDPRKYKKYGERWLLAANSSLTYLRHESPFHEDAVFIKEYYNTSEIYQMGHLTCFAGGNLMMGGRYLRRPDIENFGFELTDGCIHAYRASPLGVGPERWGYDLQQRNDFNSESFNRTGFTIMDANYYLRPEAIESVYYAYVHARDSAEKKKYQDAAWDMFRAINATCRVETGGYTGLLDVITGKAFTDTQESFWLAETLKYFWLIFNGEGRGGVGIKTGEWVFNTEAHPLLIERGK